MHPQLAIGTVDSHDDILKGHTGQVGAIDFQASIRVERPDQIDRNLDFVSCRSRYVTAGRIRRGHVTVEVDAVCGKIELIRAALAQWQAELTREFGIVEFQRHCCQCQCGFADLGCSAE